MFIIWKYTNRFYIILIKHPLILLLTIHNRKTARGRGIRFAMNGCRKTPVLRCGLVAPYVPLRFFSKRKCAMNANGYRRSGRTFLSHIPTQQAYVSYHTLNAANTALPLRFNQ